MKTTKPVTLLELFTLYPGGIRALADSCDVCADTVYVFASGKRLRFPVRAAEKIEAAFRRQRRKPYGIPVTLELLREKWHAASRARKRQVSKK